MTSSSSGGSRWCRSVAALAVISLGMAPVLGLAAPKDGKGKAAAKPQAADKKKDKGNAPAKKAYAENVTVDTTPKHSGVTLPERPAKVVTTPTLTHESLDQLVEKYLESAKVPLATPTTDVEFVRRATLDLTGKLPTPEQARGFVITKEKDKRAKLIEYLLQTDDYAHNWARYWRDVIKYRATGNGNRVPYDGLENWLADSIVKNTPWDEVAKGLITASGRDDENGATAFPISHEVQPVELAGEVSRIFMGVQIQCAQCHDHPSDSWKRQQFHEFASFFAGIRRQRVVKGGNGVRQVDAVTHNGKSPNYGMPDKKDPTHSIPVAPKFFLDPKGETLPKGLTVDERLTMAVSYVTGQDNPWFAKAYVNRVWYVLMGDAFYAPVDDMGPDRTAKAPEVLDALASEFTKSGYDVRWLFRTIMNSRAYQREVRSTFTAAGRTPFACVSPSRLRADQILDSLALVLDFPIDGSKDSGIAKDLKEAVGKTKKAGMKGGNGQRGQFNAIFGVDPSIPNEDVLGTIPQALYLMNGPQLNNAMRSSGGVLGMILARTRDNRQALAALYIRTLAREPTQKEATTCLRYIDKVGNRGEAFEDIFWSLINSTEFVTRR